MEAFADRTTIEQALHHVKSARREGSVGFGATAGAQYLDQPGCLQFESLDATISGTVGVEPQRKSIGKPWRLTVGRSRAAPFPRQSSQSTACAPGRTRADKKDETDGSPGMFGKHRRNRVRVTV